MRSLRALSLLALAAVLAAPRAARADAARLRTIALRVAERSDVGLAQAEVLWQSGWGRGSAQLGRDPDGAGLGPQAVALGPRGELALLDSANARILVLDGRGQPRRALPLPAGHARDLVAAGSRLFVLAHAAGAPGHYQVHELDLVSGQLRQSIPVPAVVPLPGALLVSGKASAPDLWIETEPNRCVPLLRGGVAVGSEAQGRVRIGRPSRGNARPLLAALTGRRDLTLGEVDERARLRPLLDLQSAHPLLAIRELTTDDAGRIYLVAVVARGDDAETSGLRQIALVLDRGGRVQQLELAAPTPLEPARPVAIAPDGTLFQLTVTADGATLRRFKPRSSAGVAR